MSCKNTAFLLGYDTDMIPYLKKTNLNALLLFFSVASFQN